MSKGLLITESMSGWVQLDNDIKRDFSFCIEAFNPKIFNLTGNRHFKGKANIAGFGSFDIHGTLVIHATGPEYSFEMALPELGTLKFKGKKTYQLSRLIYSMTHCPLTIIRDGKNNGTALLAYTDSVLSFPFKALSLQEKPDWYDVLNEISPNNKHQIISIK